MCNATTTTVHPFEKAGLCLAPFRYVGMVDQTDDGNGGRVVGSLGGCTVTTKRGGTCDYCGMAIVNMFTIKSADGKTFKVGCDCLAKVDAKLTVRAKVDVKAKKKATDAARIKAARESLPRAESLRLAPHPTAWGAANGKTMADWCEWMFANAGTTGKLNAARVVEKAL